MDSIELTNEWNADLCEYLLDSDPGNHPATYSELLLDTNYLEQNVGGCGNAFETAEEGTGGGSGVVWGDLGAPV
jgi:hypothetical protein